MLDQPRGHHADDMRMYNKNQSGAIAGRIRDGCGADTGRVRGGLHIDADWFRIVSKCQASKRGRIKEVYGILSKISRIKTASKPHRNRIETASNTPDSNAILSNWMHPRNAGWVGGRSERSDSEESERASSQPAHAHRTHGAT